MSQELKRATVLKVMDIKVISEKFKVQEVILECGDKYPSPVAFRLSNDVIDKYPLRAGDIVSDVCYNLRGREWQSPKGDIRYINSLDIWKLTVGESKKEASDSTKMMGDMAQEFNDSQANNNDDLPF